MVRGEKLGGCFDGGGGVAPQRVPSGDRVHRSPLGRPSRVPERFGFERVRRDRLHGPPALVLRHRPVRLTLGEPNEKLDPAGVHLIKRFEVAGRGVHRRLEPVEELVARLANLPRHLGAVAPVRPLRRRAPRGAVEGVPG